MRNPIIGCIGLALSTFIAWTMFSPNIVYAQTTCGTYAAGVIVQPAQGNPSGGANAVACGTGATASAAQSTAVGSSSSAGGLNAVAMGQSASASGQADTAIGAFSIASGGNSTALTPLLPALGLLRSALARPLRVVRVQSPWVFS